MKPSTASHKLFFFWIQRQLKFLFEKQACWPPVLCLSTKPGEKKKKSQSAATGALAGEDKKVHHSSGGLNKKDFPSYLGSQKVETMRKFQWAQDLCGVSSLGPDPSNKEEEEERILSQVKTVSKKRGFGRLVKGLLETTCNK